MSLVPSTTYIKLVEEPHPLRANATIWRAYYAESNLPLYMGSEVEQDLKDLVELHLAPRRVKFL